MQIPTTLDPQLLAEALALSDHPTPAALINAALQTYIQHRKQCQIINLFGTIDYDPKYDYKTQRHTS